MIRLIREGSTSISIGGRLGSDLSTLASAGIAVLPTILITTEACKAYQCNSLPQGFWSDLFDFVQRCLGSASELFLRSSPPADSIWCVDKVRAGNSRLELKNAVDSIFRSVSSPRSRASRTITEISDENASPAVLIQPFTRGLSSVLSRHGMSGAPTDENNWAENVNNRLTDHISPCINAARQAEIHLGRPVIAWLVPSEPPEVASVNDAILTNWARLTAIFDLHSNGVLSDIDLLRRIQPQFLGYLQGYAADRSSVIAVVHGSPASAGQVFGRMVFRGFDRKYPSDLPPILFVTEMVPDDIDDLEASAALVTSRGGMTSHGAVACRAMGLPSVTGCDELRIKERERVVELRDGLTIGEQTPTLVDASMGRVEFTNSAELIPQYSLSAGAGEFLARLNEVLRSISGSPLFAKLPVEDQMHLARLRSRLRDLHIQS